MLGEQYLFWYQAVVRTTVSVLRKMFHADRDGVTLRADVYRPTRQAVSLYCCRACRTTRTCASAPGDIDYFVERGYGVIMQDTRGRFASEGEEYYPLIWEMPDGYDAVEWAARLPWSDGNVGTMGQSYLGATQYLLAPTRPPHLKASVPGLGRRRFSSVLGLPHGRGL